MIETLLYALVAYFWGVYLRNGKNINLWKY